MDSKIRAKARRMMDDDLYTKFVAYTRIVRAVIDEYIACFERLDQRKLHSNPKKYFERLKVEKEECLKLMDAYISIYFGGKRSYHFRGSWPIMTVPVLREEAKFAVRMTKKLTCRQRALNGESCSDCDEISNKMITSKTLFLKWLLPGMWKTPYRCEDDLNGSHSWKTFENIEIDDDFRLYLELRMRLSDRIVSQYFSALDAMGSLWGRGEYGYVNDYGLTQRMKNSLTQFSSLYAEIFGKPIYPWFRPWDQLSLQAVLDEHEFSLWLRKLLCDHAFKRKKIKRKPHLQKAEERRVYMKNADNVFANNVKELQRLVELWAKKRQEAS